MKHTYYSTALLAFTASLGTSHADLTINKKGSDDALKFNKGALRGAPSIIEIQDEAGLSVTEKVRKITTGFSVSKSYSMLMAHAPVETVWGEKLKRSLDLALNNHKVECEDPSDHWIQDQVTQIVSTLGYDAIELLFAEDGPQIADWAWIYKYFLDQDESGEYFGTFGQHTNELKARHRMTENFWEMTDDNDVLTTDNILLLGFHGADLSSRRNMRQLVRALYPDVTRAQVYEIDETVRDFLASLPRGFDNPLLSYNAFAFDGEGLTELADDGNVYPDAIVIGDGVLEILEDTGYKLDGPDVVHAHEFGHQMQFEAEIDETGVLSDPVAEVRRLELMADAFSSFFLAHPSGGSLCVDRINELDEVAFSFGDCEVTEEGHHGTPQQRQCAANFGASLALLDAHEGLSLSPREFRDRFMAEFDGILSGDDDVCTFTVPAGVNPVPC